MTAKVSPDMSRSAPERSSDEASLISDLAGIILSDDSASSQLPLGSNGTGNAGAVARFAEALSEHRRRHAEVLHRALRELAPEFGTVIEELDAQHESLRKSTQTISEELAEGHSSNALGVARWLLVELLSHLGKESSSEASIIRALSEDQLRRLPESVMAILNPGRVESGESGGKKEWADVA